MSLTATLKPVRIFNTRDMLRKQDKKRVSSGQKALRETGRWAVKSIKRDLRAGRSGGTNFDRLRDMSRFKAVGSDIKGPKRNKAMSIFAKHVRMNAKKEGDTLILWIGFVGGGGRGGQGMVNLAAMHQKKQTRTVSKSQRAYLRRVGKELLRRNKKRMAKFFFLKATTTTLTTPAREMIDPYLEANGPAITRGVQAAYLRIIKI